MLIVAAEPGLPMAVLIGVVVGAVVVGLIIVAIIVVIIVVCVRRRRRRCVKRGFKSLLLMIKSNDDIRYCQDVFGCLPVADIVKRRTAKFLKKYKEANDIACQACIRH